MKTQNHYCEQTLEQALDAFGERVQYSVFECCFTLVEARFYLARLADTLDPETDSLRAYPLCAWCAEAAKSVGHGRRPEYERVHLL